MIVRRSALALLAAAALSLPALAAPAAKPAPARADWASKVTSTPAGGILFGNPAAKVRVIEFASFSCSHCKAFHDEGLPALKAKYLASGTVSFEQRSFVRNGPDFAASLLVACVPLPARLAFVDKLFAGQDEWLKPFIAMTQADNDKIAAAPPEQQPVEIARIGKLDAWAAARGIPPAQAKACLANKATQEELIAIRNEAVQIYKLEGTPAFGINGQPVTGVFDWASLEPKLQAALKSPKP